MLTLQRSAGGSRSRIITGLQLWMFQRLMNQGLGKPLLLMVLGIAGCDLRPADTDIIRHELKHFFHHVHKCLASSNAGCGTDACTGTLITSSWSALVIQWQACASVLK